MSKIFSNYKIIVGLLFSTLFVVMFMFNPFDGQEAVPGPTSSLEVQEVHLTATSTTKATPAQPTPEQVSAYCDFECNGYLFYIGEDRSLRRVNLENPDEVKALPIISEGTWFDLSPFGDLIVYATGEEGQQNIALMDFSGEGIRMLTQDDIQNSSPRFSPNGDKIAFSTFSDDAHNISIVDLDGNPLEAFEINACRADIDWLNEENIIFVECANQTGLSVLDINSGEVSPLTNDPGEELAPDVSPDGGRIVFSCRSAIEEDLEICLLDMASGDMQLLTNNGEQELSPSWSASGNWIVYSTSEGIIKMKEDGSDRELMYSFGMIGNSAFLWDIPLTEVLSNDEIGSESISEVDGAFQEMTNFECSECHFTVHQSHMERGIITTEHACQDCHTNLDEIHAGVILP